MGRSVNRIGGTITVLGSALFLVAAFLPISRVFPEPSPARKLEIIDADTGQWLASQVLFGMGTVLTVVGIALYGHDVRRKPFAPVAWTSVTLLAVGAAPWLWHLYSRALDPAQFADGKIPAWTSLVYFFLTEAGLALLGVALLSSPLPRWVGWSLIVSMVLSAVFTLVFGDIAPLVFYLMTLVVGVVMLFR